LAEVDVGSCNYSCRCSVVDCVCRGFNADFGATGAAVGGGLLGAVVVGTVAGAVGGAIAGFGVSIGMQGISNGFDNINWGQVGKDTLIGAISGAIAGGVFEGIKHVADVAKVS
jgi:hypothetical protein